MLGETLLHNSDFLLYLKQHEANVRSVVIDGVAPPDMRIPLYMARDGQRALDRLLETSAPAR